MSMEDQDPDTLIINNIKEPWKLLVLDFDIGMGCAPLVFLGFAAKHEILGLIVATMVAYKWQTFRNTNPRGAGLRWLWWNMPSWIWFMTKHVTPPSHKREFIG